MNCKGDIRIGTGCRECEQCLQVIHELAQKMVDGANGRSFTAADKLHEIADEFAKCRDLLLVGCLAIPRFTADKKLLSRNLLLSSVDGIEPVAVAVVALIEIGEHYDAYVWNDITKIVLHLHAYDALAILVFIADRSPVSLQAITTELQTWDLPAEKRRLNMAGGVPPVATMEGLDSNGFDDRNRPEA